MAKSLKDTGPKTHVARVVHHGEALTVPEGMEIDAAIELLTARKAYLQQKVVLVETFDAFPWDGAYALDRVLEEMYGWSQAVGIQTFFGEKPPARISIETAPGKVEQVTWGAFQLANVKGQLFSGVSEKNGRTVFELRAEILRKDEETVKRLFENLRSYLKTNSIYRGKAIKIRFYDDNGHQLEMPQPTFMATEDVDEGMLIYSKEVEASIATNLFTPIIRVHDCIDNDITIKRGILLGGQYGTGKTLAAKVAAKYAVRTGLTFIYVARADELSDAIQFAMQYQSPAAVVFCEDIDRATSGERTEELDDILNIIDGIDSKKANIITVLTTNHMENINPAMLRPGRLDSVIEVTPPDAEAVDRLLRAYGGGTIDEFEDLTAASETLQGEIPAVIAEVVKRAKLSQLRLQEPGTPVTCITGPALAEASRTMKTQLHLLHKDQTTKPVTIEDILTRVLERHFEESTLGGVIRQIEERLDN